MSVAEVDARLPDPSKQQLGESMARDFLNLRNYRYKDLNHWMEKQTYTAVGLTVMAAAELGVEATPLEGFDPPVSTRPSRSARPELTAAGHEVLGLVRSDAAATAVAAAGGTPLRGNLTGLDSLRAGGACSPLTCRRRVH